MKKIIAAQTTRFCLCCMENFPKETFLSLQGALPWSDSSFNVLKQLQVWFLWWTPHFTADHLPSDLDALVSLSWLQGATQTIIYTQVSH